jgi:hypothetical protein
VAVHNLPDWAVAISHRFRALPDNFLVTEKISHRFILLPENFLEIYVRKIFKIMWSFSAVCQMTPQRFELLVVLKKILLLKALNLL